MFNRIILIGRLTRDPELRYTQSSSLPVANFTLAVDRPYKNKQGDREVDFIDITAWRKLAEVCAEYLYKGRQVAVEGRLEIQHYETQDGQKRKAAKVMADNVYFLSGPKEKKTQENNESNVADGVSFSEDEIPF